VKAAAKRTLGRTGEKVPQKPASQIQNYLDRFKEIIEHNDPVKRERGIDAIKQVLLGKFVTKFDEIPNGFWQSQEQIVRERGQQADYDLSSEEKKKIWQQEIAEGLLGDQRASLEQWIDYLASPDSVYMPDYIKYWAFRSVTNLQEYDKEHQKFPQRSKGTVKMFPDINHEALSYVIDAVIKKQKGEGFSFDQFNYDLTEKARQDFKNYLQLENFAELYAWANELIQPIPKHLLPITEGSWVKYKQGSDYIPLVQSIRGRGTGWCTAGENTAKSQLAGGDFYVFYSHNDDNQPINPRIAIRMVGNHIAEVRGIGYKQNLDPYVNDVLAAKLQEFPDRDPYLKKEADMKRLTEVERKSVSNQELSKEDLIFLYEINGIIEGFGYQKDPRVDELRSGRNLNEDMLVVFDCIQDQIAHSPTEIRPDTKAFVGKLEAGIFDLLPSGMEHVYTSFPEGKIRRFYLEIGGESSEDLQAYLRNGNFQVSDCARDMLNSQYFATLIEPKTIGLVRLKVSALGFTGSTATEELFRRAKELGLELSPAEVGPHLRLTYKNQPMGEWFYIGMKPITDRHGSPDIFKLERYEGGAWLSAGWANPYDSWRPYDEFVFSLRKS